MDFKVQNKLFTGNVKLNSGAQANFNNSSTMSKNSTKTSVNQLVDKNYGSLLVKNNKVSFTGMPRVQTLLSIQISEMLPMLQRGEVLLVGKDPNKAIKLLQESASAFKTGVKQIFFHEAPGLDSTFAFYSKGGGKQDLVNLEKDALKIVSSKSNASITVSKGGKIPLKPNDKIITAQNDEINLYSVVEQPPFYKVGYGEPIEREFIDSHPATLKKVGYGIQEEKARLKGRTKKTGKSVGYKANDEEKNISKIRGTETIKEVGYGKKGDRTPTPEGPIHKVGYGKREVWEPAKGDQPIYKIGYGKRELRDNSPNPNPPNKIGFKQKDKE